MTQELLEALGDSQWGVRSRAVAALPDLFKVSHAPFNPSVTTPPIRHRNFPIFSHRIFPRRTLAVSTRGFYVMPSSVRSGLRVCRRQTMMSTLRWLELTMNILINTQSPLN